jgi:cobalt/nickel transport system permease protein
MHISEGVLSAPVLIGCASAAVICTGVGLKKIRPDQIMTVALLTATFFVASLIHVPVGPGNIHLVLNGLLGIVLGWASFPAILVALLLQTLFFQFGGITVLGVNVLIMALPAVCSFYLVKPWLRHNGRKRAVAAFLGGFFAIFLSSAIMALVLVVTAAGFWDTAKLLIMAHFPLMVVEGCVTMFIVLFLAKVQPEILCGGSS